MSTKSVIRSYQVLMLESDMEELKVRTNTTTAKDALTAATRNALEAKQ